MRLFIAIELDEIVRKELADIQSRLKQSGADVKWVEPDNIHLTLKFLGDTPDNKIQKIKDTLKEIAGRTNAFRCVRQKTRWGHTLKVCPQVCPH